MSDKFDVQKYMITGVENIVKNAVRATLENPKESAFILKFGAASREASQKRRKAEEKGEHIPAFLIASITSSCNLHCAGCYSRANHACTDEAAFDQLSSDEWRKIFREAQELGISFILLAGGEPMVRRDVIKAAAEFPSILFPIFTNGTMLDEKYVELLEKHRNLVPVFSIEGDETATDRRRGEGIYKRLISGMDAAHEKGLLYGASVTVTTENLHESYDEAFIESLRDKGCKLIFYIEYVPVTEESKHLAPQDAERKYAEERLAAVREKYPDMIFVSFPGDEMDSGGCLAAGRGFFHINSHGGAEPCPFSPYSDVNVRDTSLREALNSKLFYILQSEDMLTESHAGGCVLFEKREQVEAALRR